MCRVTFNHHSRLPIQYYFNMDFIFINYTTVAFSRMITVSVSMKTKGIFHSTPQVANYSCASTVLCILFTFSIYYRYCLRKKIDSLLCAVYYIYIKIHYCRIAILTNKTQIIIFLSVYLYFQFSRLLKRTKIIDQDCN